MRAPSGIYPGEHTYIVGVKERDVRYKATGEYRPPRKGEYFLSGAIIAAYRAPNDLDTPYWIAVPGKVTTTTTHTWKPLRKDGDPSPDCSCRWHSTCHAFTVCARCLRCARCAGHAEGCAGCVLPADVAEETGTVWNGIQYGLAPGQELALFTDPKSHDTVSIPLMDVSTDTVIAALTRKRAEYA